MTSSTGNKMQQNEKAAAAAEEDELADIQELFQSVVSNGWGTPPPHAHSFRISNRFYDTKGDGHIWADQLGDCLRAIGLCPTQAQLTQLHSAVQQPQGGGEEQQQQQQQRISAEQFLPMLHAIRKQGAKDRNELELATFLENLDRDGQVMGGGGRRMDG